VAVLIVAAAGLAAAWLLASEPDLGEAFSGLSAMLPG